MISEHVRQTFDAVRHAVAQTLIQMIGLYQKFISPLTGCNCRYQPSCSCYSVTAIETHGIARGLLLTLLRILRCNPLFNGGLDPVPEKFNLSRKRLPDGY